MLKKLFNSFTLKYLPFYAATFLLSVAINSLSGNYWINFSVATTFTNSEAQALVNRRVTLNCLKNPLSGKVISQQMTDFYNQRQIMVEWDTPLGGKYKTTPLDKKFVEQCVTVAE